MIKFNKNYPGFLPILIFVLEDPTFWNNNSSGALCLEETARLYEKRYIHKKRLRFEEQAYLNVYWEAFDLYNQVIDQFLNLSFEEQQRILTLSFEEQQRILIYLNEKATPNKNTQDH